MNFAAFLSWQGGISGGLGGFMLPLLLMFGIMYFLVIMPQQKQKKKMQEMLGAVKNGDKVVTTSGIYGTINGIARAAIAQVETTEDAK
jgi:preprotein translocase subunit YajC